MSRGRFDRGHAVGGCDGGTSRVSTRHCFVDGADLSRAPVQPVIIEADNSRTVTKVSHSSTTETLALHLGRDRGRNKIKPTIAIPTKARLVFPNCSPSNFPR